MRAKLLLGFPASALLWMCQVYAQTSLPDAALERLIQDYSNPATIRTDVAQTGSVKVVYLCDDQTGIWVVAVRGITAEPLTKLKFVLKGLPEGDISVYHNYELETAKKGDGLFLAIDVGPLDKAAETGSAYVPLSYASISIEASTNGGATVRSKFESLPERTIQQLARCMGRSFPRVLHKRL